MLLPPSDAGPGTGSPHVNSPSDPAELTDSPEAAALQEVTDLRRSAAAVKRMRQLVSEGEIDFAVIERAD